MEKLLTGKTAIVTGAARRIGKAVALKFAEEGANIVMVDILEDDLKQTKAQVVAFRTKVTAIPVDLTKDEQVYAMVDQVTKEYGTVDILMNNAGISREMPFHEMPMDTFDKIIEINLRSVALIMKAVLPVMMKIKAAAFVPSLPAQH